MERPHRTMKISSEDQDGLELEAVLSSTKAEDNAALLAFSESGQRAIRRPLKFCAAGACFFFVIKGLVWLVVLGMSSSVLMSARNDTTAQPMTTSRPPTSPPPVESAQPVERTRTLLDSAGWKFRLDRTHRQQCNASSFPVPRNDRRCLGLTFQAQVDSATGCQEACCNSDSCEVWQWCAHGDACGEENHCWTGTAHDCARPSQGWVGASRSAPPEPPTPSPGYPCRVAECEPSLDDTGWRDIVLPHDFILEGDFTSRADKVHGYLPFASGWYRHHFTLPAEASAGRATVWLEFDGVQRDSVAYINGKYLCSHLSGYTPHRCHLAPSLAVFDGRTPNVLAVHVDATRPDGWWYDGGGIYRHVWLVVAPLLKIAPWGVYLPAHVVGLPDHRPAGGSVADALIMPHTTVHNNGSEAVAAVSVRNVIRDGLGAVVGVTTSAPASIGAGEAVVFNVSVRLRGARLWSPESPSLYTCETTLRVGGAATVTTPVDASTDSFGIRSVVWDPSQGLLLNSVPMKVQGFANHQDFAGVGVAVPDSLQAYRVWAHKEMGANAWRTAHNPPNSALLDECDRQGLLVWDENHRNLETADMVEDLRTMLLRDRNHPSIVMFGLCNEALCEKFDVDTARALKSIFKAVDPLGQRPLTAAMNGGYSSGFNEILDVVGINYHIDEYDIYHRAHPGQPMIGSETSSDVSDRGVYANDATQGYVAAYDVNHPAWGSTEEDSWCAIEERPFIAGAFCWTGFDYKGEPTPYGWPNVNSHFGVMDITGMPKDNYHYYRSVFIDMSTTPILHIFPHWNWDEGMHGVPCAGRCRLLATDAAVHELAAGSTLPLPPHRKTVEVWAYGNGAAVELSLNGQSLGVQRLTRCRHVNWTVPYTPGALSAKLYSAEGDVVATQTIATTGAPYALRLQMAWPAMGDATMDALKPEPELSAANATGGAIAIVTAAVVDAVGAVVPTAMIRVRFVLKPASVGSIIGLGNGDPSSHEADRPAAWDLGVRSAWNGYARVIIQAAGLAGTIAMTAEADGLKGAEILIAVR